LRLVGLTSAAGKTFSRRDLVVVLASPVIITLDWRSTGFVVTVNVCDLSPAGTTTVGATVLATAALLVDRSTVTGPGPAEHSSVAVPVDG
jgi:hypothetical protein